MNYSGNVNSPALGVDRLLANLFALLVKIVQFFKFENDNYYT